MYLKSKLYFTALLSLCSVWLLVTESFYLYRWRSIWTSMAISFCGRLFHNMFFFFLVWVHSIVNSFLSIGWFRVVWCEFYKNLCIEHPGICAWGSTTWGGRRLPRRRTRRKRLVPFNKLNHWALVGKQYFSATRPNRRLNFDFDLVKG